ncbi:MAG: UbiX family flavin prenyltransferase [Burkholderiaceae bacterium]
MNSPPVLVAITGASGASLGVGVLEQLRQIDGLRTHLIVSPAGWMNLEHELDRSRDEIEALADETHSFRDVGASIASGSFSTAGMIIAPCSMRTLAAVACGLSDNLITRAADVTLKERRRLILMARETPLNLAHLRNMTSVTEMGGIVFPPVPAYYNRPESVQQMTTDLCARAIDLLQLCPPVATQWAGLRAGKTTD